MKLLYIILLILLIPATVICSENITKIPITISVNFDKEGKAEVSFGNVNINKKLSSEISSIKFRNPEEGIKLRLNGIPEKIIKVTFSSAEIKGENNQIIFTPYIEQTSSHVLYEKAAPVESGVPFTLDDYEGEGYVFLWICGELNLGNVIPEGSYSGTFEINIIY